jgi:hypothetical protein
VENTSVAAFMISCPISILPFILVNEITASVLEK